MEEGGDRGGAEEATGAAGGARRPDTAAGVAARGGACGSGWCGGGERSGRRIVRRERRVQEPRRERVCAGRWSPGGHDLPVQPPPPPPGLRGRRPAEAVTVVDFSGRSRRFGLSRGIVPSSLWCRLLGHCGW